MATPRKHSFELEGADGRALRGDLRTAGGGTGRPAVVICHGFKGFKDWGFFPWAADRLAKAGMTAVSFNFSGSGVGADGESFSEPERFGHMTISNDLQDLSAVCSLLQAGRLVEGVGPPTRIGLLGHSKGGGIALLHAAEHSEIAALVTWAPISSALRWDAQTVRQWRRDGDMDVVNVRTKQVLPLYLDYLDDLEEYGERLDILRAAGRVDIPWLIVHGDSDESVPLSEGRALYHAASSRNVALHVIKGGGHTFGARHPWNGSTAALEEAASLTVEWFVTYLF